MNGAAEMIAKLRQLAIDYPNKVAGAIYMEAQLILEVAKDRCPVAPDGGILNASGQVSDPIINGGNVSVIISFGGAADAYAIAVHEHLSEHSPHSWKVAVGVMPYKNPKDDHGGGVHWSEPGTGPKFLEDPVNEAMPGMLDRLAARLQLS